MRTKLRLVSLAIPFVLSTPARLDGQETPEPMPPRAPESPEEEESPTPPTLREDPLTGILSEEEFKALHTLSKDAPAPGRGTRVTLSDGSSAYLALPEDAQTPVPGVIVIHEWWGRNGHIELWTDRLAADGYAALAVDLYGGEVATTRDDAMRLMRSVDEGEAKATVAAAHAFLVSDERVKASATASIGWCFGGLWSLNAARTIPELDAAVVYYGHVPTDPELLRPIEANVLGIFGNEDRSIPHEHVTAFEAALEEAEVVAEIHRYEAPHAFANPSSERYDEIAATDAWYRVRAFLERTLKPSDEMK